MRTYKDNPQTIILLDTNQPRHYHLTYKSTYIEIFDSETIQKYATFYLIVMTPFLESLSRYRVCLGRARAYAIKCVYMVRTIQCNGVECVLTHAQ